MVVASSRDGARLRQVRHMYLAEKGTQPTANLTTATPAALSPHDASPAMPSWIDAATIQVKELAWLDHNWDGYGSPPISQTSIDAAQRILPRIETFPSPAIAPTPEGGIAFEWRRGRNYATLEITKSGDLEIIYDLEDSEPYAGEIGDAPLDHWMVIQKLLL